MTLVKNKKRVTTHQRKIAGEHHRKNQNYLKPYWPYLPILIILGGAFAANDYLPASFNSAAVPSGSARIDSVVGSHNSSLIALLSIVLLALVVWFVIRHMKRLKKLATRGEQILAKNFMLDVVAALLIAGLYVMLR